MASLSLVKLSFSKKRKKGSGTTVEKRRKRNNIRKQMASLSLVKLSFSKKRKKGSGTTAGKRRKSKPEAGLDFFQTRRPQPLISSMHRTFSVKIINPIEAIRSNRTLRQSLA